MEVNKYIRLSGDVREGQCCPECKASWDGGDILDYFLEAKFNPNHEQHIVYSNTTTKEIKKIAKAYGWSKKNPKRFSRLIGIDCSWDLNVSHEDTYDGISYWKCPNCDVAWHRFSGERTEKFIEKVAPIIDKGEIIYNAIKTPDGTIIESKYRHDFVSYEDANGKIYSVDGGHDYIRRVGDVSECEELTLYLEPWSPEFHEKARLVVKRGGMGKNGDEPLKWVPICEMSDKWVLATIEYNTERGMPVETNWFTNLLHEEMNYRNTHSISIDDK